MPGSPNASELLNAVRDFITGLPLEGRDAFHAKVASNVLAIVERELAMKPEVIEAEVLPYPVAELCAPLRDGTLTPATPGLIDALITATTARLGVDNPRYATLARLTDPPPLDR